MDALSFGIKTTPAEVGYDELRRVWLDADAIPEIEHAWLYDHLIPRVAPSAGPLGAADRSGPVHEGWTLLSALAAQTERLRLGLLVTNNRIREPSVLAKMAATVDIVSCGRLDFGIGIGGLPDTAAIAPEYDAYGIPIAPWPLARARFAEACTLIRRMWTEELFDFHGEHYRLTGARCNPKPVQDPYPPILIGGLGIGTLRIVAEHADIWNVIGPPVNSLDLLTERAAALDRLCAELGRDPATITRSAQLPLGRQVYDDPAPTRERLVALARAGFTHLVLNVPAPYPDRVARWTADELILPAREALAAPPPIG